MQDFSLFLLKNWLPVGLSAITFFVIGLLLAKSIWGRYQQRLTFAVEENLNLASQWSALGSSQRDLFKKLRSRWQADRDVWESQIQEHESELEKAKARIEQLTGALNHSGKSVPEAPAISEADLKKIRDLESKLRNSEVEIATLKQAAIEKPSVSPIALAASAKSAEELSEHEPIQRIQDLEQDLIDAHDELHSVRSEYEKQSNLVESLEARLIERGETQDLDLKSESSAPSFRERQLDALLQWKQRETLSHRDEIAALRTTGRNLEAQLADAKDSAGARINDLESALELANSDLEGSRNELSNKESQIRDTEAKVTALSKRLEEAAVMESRKVQIQAELNDAHHEMYDVRSALNDRLDEIELLEGRLDELDVAEAERNEYLIALKQATSEVKDLRVKESQSSESLKRILGEKEELEAIIEDRSAEVEDLSTEVRQQRDALRELRAELAEQQGEMEALTAETESMRESSGEKNAMIEARTQRISDLESALATRYEEMNSARASHDEELKAALALASRTEELESELQRQAEAFEESSRLTATSEEALEQANQQIRELTDNLNQSDEAIQSLRSEVSEVAREKDECIREIEEAGLRVEELETASRVREEELDNISQELKASRKENHSLNLRIERLNLELESAKAARSHSQTTLAELEEALKESDSKTLKLSSKLDHKEKELEELGAKLVSVSERLDKRKQRLSEGQEAIESTKQDLETRVASLARGEVEGKPSKDKEVARLRRELALQHAKLESYERQRKQSSLDFERLRDKLAARGDDVRELQAELSQIMIQRASRDDELALLKDKLRAIETSDAADFEAIIAATLSEDQETEEGTSLDDLEGVNVESATRGHHELGPSESSETVRAIQPVADDLKEGDDDHAVFFDETSADLTDSGARKIDEFARQVRRHGRKTSVTIIGFSGPEGTADYTESLSARRAEAVRERLLERGVPQARITVENSGQDRRFTNWRARRVELVQVAHAVAESVN